MGTQTYQEVYGNYVYGGINNDKDPAVLVTGGDLNAGFTTPAIDISGYNSIMLGVSLTHDLATDVNMTAEFAFVNSPGASDWYLLQYIDETAVPPQISQDAEWQKPVTSDLKWTWFIGKLKGKFVRFTFSGTFGVGAPTDTVDVVSLVSSK